MPYKAKLYLGYFILFIMKKTSFNQLGKNSGKVVVAQFA